MSASLSQRRPTADPVGYTNTISLQVERIPLMTEFVHPTGPRAKDRERLPTSDRIGAEAGTACGRAAAASVRVAGEYFGPGPRFRVSTEVGLLHASARRRSCAATSTSSSPPGACSSSASSATRRRRRAPGLGRPAHEGPLRDRQDRPQDRNGALLAHLWGALKSNHLQIRSI